MSTVFLLKRTELAVRACVESALEGLELTPTQFLMLLLARFGRATSSAELARAMGVTPQSMTELVLPLEQAGAIVRRPDPAHGRILRIEFTSTGERLLARAIEIAGKVEEELLAGLTERDRNHLGRSFRKLMANAETFDSDRRRRSRKGRGSNATKKSGPMRGRAR